MTDLPIIMALTLIFTFQTLALEAQEEIYDVRATNAMLWEESSIIGERYNACKQQIRRKR